MYTIVINGLVVLATRDRGFCGRLTMRLQAVDIPAIMRFDVNAK